LWLPNPNGRLILWFLNAHFLTVTICYHLRSFVFINSLLIVDIYLPIGVHELFFNQQPWIIYHTRPTPRLRVTLTKPFCPTVNVLTRSDTSTILHRNR